LIVYIRSRLQIESFIYSVIDASKVPSAKCSHSSTQTILRSEHLAQPQISTSAIPSVLLCVLDLQYKMKLLALLSFVAALAQAQTWVPIHGCEWVPEKTAIANFTLTRSPSNSSTPAYVAWQAPALRVACNATAPVIGTPGSTTNVNCVAASSQDTQGTFKVSPDGSSVTLMFIMYQGCAASIYEFGYKAEFGIVCGEGGNCVSRGNASATAYYQNWL
jgi:hypothetical protein